jgi:hypothetical protein
MAVSASPASRRAMASRCWCGVVSAWPTHVHAVGLGSRPAFAGPRLDQFFLKFSQAAQDRQHQPAVWSRGIGPGIGQRLEAGASLGDLIQGVEQVPRRSGQPVKPRHHQYIASAKPVHDLA